MLEEVHSLTRGKESPTESLLSMPRASWLLLERLSPNTKTHNPPKCWSERKMENSFKAEMIYYKKKAGKITGWGLLVVNLSELVVTVHGTLIRIDMLASKSNIKHDTMNI